MADVVYLIGSGTGSGGGGGGGSEYWKDPVANFATLPGSGNTTGDTILTTDTGIVYYWDGSAWEPIDTELASVAVSDTNSVDHTVTGGVLSSDVKISSNAASGAGFFKSTTTIQSSGSVGLHVENPYATGAQDGILKSADFTTFNNKEPAITAGTTDDYYRGDKSFQVLQVSALKPITDGSSASAGKIGEILTGTQATNTTTGVGATGDWGSVTSVSLTAGVWEIEGVCAFNENGSVLSDFVACGISDSATGVGISEFDTTQQNSLGFATSDLIIKTPRKLISINSTTTYYLNSKFNYTGATPRHRGRIQALRIR